LKVLDPVKIRWISVTIAPLDFFSAAIVTDIQQIFTSLTDLNLVIKTGKKYQLIFDVN